MGTITAGYTAVGAARDHVTLLSAHAAANDGDTIEYMYTNNHQGVYANEAVTFTKRVNLVGVIPNAKTTFRQLTINVALVGDMLIQDIISNRNFSGTTQPGSTGTLTLNRCSTCTTMVFLSATNGGSVLLTACKLANVDADGVSGESGAYLTCYNCQVIGAQVSGFKWCNAYNCIGLGSVLNDFNACGGSHNAYQKLNGTAFSDSIATTMEDVGFITPENGGAYRLAHDSPLVGAGNAFALAPAKGFYLSDFSAPPAIGANEGLFVESDADNVLTTAGGDYEKADKTKVLTGNDFGVGGTSEVAAYAPDFPAVGAVIEGATTDGDPGTYHEATTGEVKAGTLFGPGSTYTGTLATGDSPAAPTLTSATGGDTTLTLAVVPATGEEATPIHAYIWEVSGAVSVSAQTITGAGDLVLTGLTNGTVYGVAAVHKSGDLLGAPSTVYFGQPTDATFAPVSLMAKPLDILADMIAATGAWQTITDTDNSVDAKAKIHLNAVNAATATTTNDQYRDAITAARPFCVLSTGEEWAPRAVGLVTTITAGQIVLEMEIAVPTEYQGFNKLSEAKVNFENSIGLLVSDLMALSGTDEYLHVGQIALIGGPERTSEDEAAAEGDACWVALAVSWGIS